MNIPAIVITYEGFKSIDFMSPCISAEIIQVLLNLFAFKDVLKTLYDRNGLPAETICFQSFITSPALVFPSIRLCIKVCWKIKIWDIPKKSLWKVCVYVYRSYTKNFVEIRAILGISISQLNLQSILPKNTKEIICF